MNVDHNTAMIIYRIHWTCKMEWHSKRNYLPKENEEKKKELNQTNIKSCSIKRISFISSSGYEQPIPTENPLVLYKQMQSSKAKRIQLVCVYVYFCYVFVCVCVRAFIQLYKTREMDGQNNCIKCIIIR